MEANNELAVIEIKKALLDARISQVDLAREAGVSVSYFNKILRGTYGYKGEKSDRIREIIKNRLGSNLVVN